MQYEHIIAYLTQPVLILDRLNQVHYINEAFVHLYPRVRLREHVHAYSKDYPELLPLFTCLEGHYPLKRGERHYSVNVSFARYGRREIPVARCMLFSDETETVLLLDEIEQQKNLLAASNRQIQAQNAALEESIQIERRTASLRAQARLLRDVHDTLGHTLVMVGTLYSLARDALPDARKAQADLNEALRWIGISLAKLESAGDYSSGSFVGFLHRFRDAMGRIDLDVILSIQGEEMDAHGYMYTDLMHICLEAATNSLKHGSATRFCIDYRLDADKVALRLTDNGHSAQIMGNGHGLRGMDERVNALFGDFSYGWKEDGGFYVTVDAPLISDEE